MAGHASRDEKLFAGGKMRDTLRRMRGISPGPGGKFVDDVVACKDKFFGSDLAGVAKRRGV